MVHQSSQMHCADTALISIIQIIFLLAWPACISNAKVRLHTYVHVGLSLSPSLPLSLTLSRCVSPISNPPPLCSGPWIKSFISFTLLSPLLLSPSLCLYSLILSACPPPSLPPSLSLIHRLQMPKENEPVSKRLARTARQKLLLFCFHLLVCLFMPSIRFLIMTLPRDRSHMCWDLSAVWSGIGTLPPHTH